MALLWDILGHLILAWLLFILTGMTIWYTREIIKRIKEIKALHKEIKNLERRNK